MARRQVQLPSRPVSGTSCTLRGEGQEAEPHQLRLRQRPLHRAERSRRGLSCHRQAARGLSSQCGGQIVMADQNENIPATVPEQPESKPPLRKSMPVVIVLVVIVALIGIANISSLLSGNKRVAPQS